MELRSLESIRRKRRKWFAGSERIDVFLGVKMYKMRKRKKRTFFFLELDCIEKPLICYHAAVLGPPSSRMHIGYPSK